MSMGIIKIVTIDCTCIVYLRIGVDACNHNLKNVIVLKIPIVADNLDKSKWQNKLTVRETERKLKTN